MERRERVRTMSPLAPSIPHTFHFVWFGDEPPALDYRDTWAQHHPDWEFKLWTDESDWTWLENYSLFANAGYHAPHFEGQFKADIARYEILLKMGGVYVDYDFECQRSIAGLLDNDLPSQRLEPLTACAAWEEQDVWVNNAFMGATPEHRFFRALVDHLPANVTSKRGSRPNKLTGPQYLTRLHRIMPNELVVFPQESFYPYSWDELERRGEEFPKAYAIHHWNNKRRMARA